VTTRGIYVNLFIGSTVKIDGVAGTDVQLVQITDHPRSGDVAIVVNPAEENRFSIHVRAPNRRRQRPVHAQPASDGITLDLGERFADRAADVVNGYAVITRSGRPATRSS
jgi:uncharacterized protein